MPTIYDFNNWKEAPASPEDYLLEEQLPFKIEGQSQAERAVAGPSNYAERMLQFAAYQGWEDFYWLANAPYPDRIIRQERWKLVPFNQDYVDLHTKARKRIDLLIKARFVFRGLVIAHELPTSAGQHDNSLNPHSYQEKSLAYDLGRSAVEVGERVIPAALGVVAVIGGVALALAATTLTAVAAGLAAVDPVVIGVTRDNSWIEIFRWNE